MSKSVAAVYETNLKSLPLVQKGKVRDIYAVGEDHFLIVTTDRLSAFDVVLPDPVPRKGSILTEISNFWFERTSEIIRNHLTDITLESVVPNTAERAPLEGRSIVVKKVKPLAIEAVVRGYLIGSGWKDYQKNGSVCGLSLPPGLKLGQKLPEPIYTPSTKAPVGDHDENISFEQSCDIVGADLAEEVRSVTLDIYSKCAEFALERGIIIADTKMEFGLDSGGDLILIDELLTPDSSRFWPAASYEVGISPPSFDKQFVRDYLETLDWDKTDPGPNIPEDTLARTTEKYQEALNILTQ
ncbi:MAG: phosphoribosylaminoimidazolesuccinocarboxamide synthase [Gammaproteobacteria bacterium]